MDFLPAVLATAALIAALFVARTKTGLVRNCAFVVAGVIGLAVGFGLVPGFGRIEVGPVSFGSGKAVLGLCLAIMLPSALGWSNRVSALLVGAIILLPLLGAISGFAQFAPALSIAVLWFAIGNLPSTIAEDFFFRRFVQDHLTRFGRLPEILVTAGLFGLVHLGGGPLFAGLAFVAGLFYSAAYRASGNSVWAVVAVHMAVNIVRVVCFGVP